MLNKNKRNYPSSLIYLLYSVYKKLTKIRKIQLFVVFLTMLASGFAEVVSLTSIIPLLSILIDPNKIWEIEYFSEIITFFGIKSNSQILFFSTFLFIFAAVLSSIVRLINLWISNRVVAGIGGDISCEAYKITMFQPYSVHLYRNSSKVITATTAHTSDTVAVLSSALQFITSIIITLFLICALLYFDWKIAIICSTAFGFCYLLIVLGSRKKLIKNSRIVAQSNQLRIKALQEGLGAIRDVILDKTQGYYASIYRRADRPLRLKEAQSWFLASAPRYLLEAIGLSIISFLALFLSLTSPPGFTIVPLLGAIAFGAQRLLPSLQMIYSQWAFMSAHTAAVQNVLRILDEDHSKNSFENSIPKLLIVERIRLKNISFQYKNSNKKVLNNINLEFSKGEKVGIIGSTGSGKSTLFDILMGLIIPTKGSLLIDDLDVTNDDYKKMPSWQSNIAHVPQSIYLSDTSFAENIAFGIPLNKIDMEKVKEAATLARIDKFINNFKDGYYSRVGERGSNISGGQRQRIAIARALYKDADVIFFDEATSALDMETERDIISTLFKACKQKNLFLIAHRLTTIKSCDKIVKIDNGKVCLEGGPQSIIK